MQEPLYVSPGMAAFAMSIDGGRSVRQKAFNLYHALLSDGLDIRYNDNMSEYWRPRGSKSASDVFEETGLDGFRFATSLEYTLLHIAIGRELGLHVQAFRQDTSQPIGQDHLSAYIVSGVLDNGRYYLIDLAGQHFYHSVDGFTPLSDINLEAYHYYRSSIILRMQRRNAEAEAFLKIAQQRDVEGALSVRS